MNFPRDHFRIKTECAFALRQFDISQEALLFLPDEVERLTALFKDGRLEIALVDHNNPVEALGSMTSSIVLVLDHHQLILPSRLPAEAEKIMKLVGSCSSIVSRWAREERGLSDPYPADLSRLLAQTMLIDTANFSPNQLVDDLDREEYEKVTLNLPEWNGDGEYDTIVQARFDITGLSTRELLLKDAKFVPCANGKSIFASTLHCDLQDFFHRENGWDEIDSFYHSAEAKGAELLLFMGTVSSGLNRGFGWYAPKMEDGFTSSFRAWQDTVESFQLGEYDSLPEMKVYAGARTITGSDGKVVSRKKAMPLLIPWFQATF